MFCNPDLFFYLYLSSQQEPALFVQASVLPVGD